VSSVGWSVLGFHAKSQRTAKTQRILGLCVGDWAMSGDRGIAFGSRLVVWGQGVSRRAAEKRRGAVTARVSSFELDVMNIE